jgi:hypothetical protein
MRSYYIIFIVFYFSTFITSCKAQQFIKVSKVIDEQQRGGRKTTMKTFHDVRSLLYKEHQDSFLKLPFDTLFFLEQNIYEENVYVGKIWNRKGTLEYEYTHNKFFFNGKGVFQDKLCALVMNWDVEKIKKIDSTASDAIPENRIYASIVICHNNSCEVKSISFKSFLNLPIPER